MKKRSVFARLQIWLQNHLRACCHAAGQLRQQPINNSLTIAVIAIALALPFGLYSIVNSIHHSGKPTAPSLSVYTKNTRSRTVAALKEKLLKLTQIKKLRYISPTAGLQQLLQDQSAKTKSLRLDNNPLPGVFVITPKADYSSPLQIKILSNTLKELPQISLVQVNMTWLKRLYYITEFSKRLTLALAIVFCLGVFLIINNTIRLITQRNQNDIQIMRLFGATANFIRRPLLYRGIILGFCSGMLAWLVVNIMLLWLNTPLKLFAQSYNQHSPLASLQLQTGATLIILSTLLAYIASWLAIKPYLSAEEE
jgi:cell division transport system permease protein